MIKLITLVGLLGLAVVGSGLTQRMQQTPAEPCALYIR